MKQKKDQSMKTGVVSGVENFQITVKWRYTTTQGFCLNSETATQ